MKTSRKKKFQNKKEDVVVNSSKQKKLIIEEGHYYYTRGGWIAKIIHINDEYGVCYAIHNPGTPLESTPILHDLDTGFAKSLFSIGQPPAYSGHPADLSKEVKIQ